MTVILGVKDGMTQLFNAEGHAVPVTAIAVEPNTVTQVKTLERDGYDAIQVGCGDRAEKQIKKPQLGHFKASGRVNYRFVQEFRTNGEEEFKVGDTIEISSLEEGQKIIVSSVSKGKGFQGGVKRYNFSGGRRSHGNKHSEREGGSIGAGGPQRVFKGVKMPGRMGSDRITIKNLTIAKIDSENNRIFVRGSLAGKRGDIVEIVTK
jgi:large subunit ribosomal protein L3